MRALQPAAKSKGGVLMPVCGVCVGPGHPSGAVRVSWAYSDARKQGAAQVLPPPCPPLCPSPSLGPTLLQHGCRSVLAHLESSPRLPTETRAAPKAKGLPC